MKQYKNYLIKFAQDRRQNQTYGEMKLWSKLRSKRFLDLKFKRQVPILEYIVDFYCKEKELVIEIDGSSHDETKFEYDLNREKRLREVGLLIVRFTESEVVRSVDSVLDTLTLILSQERKSK